MHTLPNETVCTVKRKGCSCIRSKQVSISRPLVPITVRIDVQQQGARRRQALRRFNHPVDIEETARNMRGNLFVFRVTAARLRRGQTALGLHAIKQSPFWLWAGIETTQSGLMPDGSLSTPSWLLFIRSSSFHRLHQALVIWILNVLYVLALLRRSLSAVRDLLAIHFYQTVIHFSEACFCAVHSSFKLHPLLLPSLEGEVASRSHRSRCFPSQPPLLWP